MYIESLSKSMANWMVYHNTKSDKNLAEASFAAGAVDPRQRLINSQYSEEMLSDRSL